MNQNIFGAILFSIIVGTAIFVSAYFVTLPAPPTIYETPAYESRVSCHKVVNETKSKFEFSQVIFDTKTQKIRAVIHYNNLENIDQSIFLHIFIKNNNSTKYLVTQELHPSVEITSGNVYTNKVKINQLSNLKSFENLYVIAESKGDYDENVKPMFNAETAIPVLLDNGKN